MRIIVDNIKWVMLVSGLLTATMVYAAFAPQAALQSSFGATLEPGPVTEIVVRNWGALVGMVGFMLIYGAFHQPVRSLVLIVAIASKLVFIGLVMAQGSSLPGGQARVAVVIDLVMVALFTAYLIIRQSTASTVSPPSDRAPSVQ